MTKARQAAIWREFTVWWQSQDLLPDATYAMRVSAWFGWREAMLRAYAGRAVVPGEIPGRRRPVNAHEAPGPHLI